MEKTTTIEYPTVGVALNHLKGFVFIAPHNPGLIVGAVLLATAVMSSVLAADAQLIATPAGTNLVTNSDFHARSGGKPGKTEGDAGKLKVTQTFIWGKLKVTQTFI